MTHEAKFADYCDPQLYDESLLHDQPKLVEKSLYLRNEYYSRIQVCIVYFHIYS